MQIREPVEVGNLRNRLRIFSLPEVDHESGKAWVRHLNPIMSKLSFRVPDLTQFKYLGIQTAQKEANMYLVITQMQQAAEQGVLKSKKEGYMYANQTKPPCRPS